MHIVKEKAVDQIPEADATVLPGVGTFNYIRINHFGDNAISYIAEKRTAVDAQYIPRLVWNRQHKPCGTRKISVNRRFAKIHYFSVRTGNKSAVVKQKARIFDLAVETVGAYLPVRAARFGKIILLAVVLYCPLCILEG